MLEKEKKGSDEKTVRDKGWSEYPGLNTGEVFQRRFKAFVAKETRLLLNRRGTIEYVVNYTISYWKENGRSISNNECSKKINETHWIVRDKIGYLLTTIAQLELIKLKRDKDTEQQTATQAKRKTTVKKNSLIEGSDDDIDALPTTKRQRPKQNPLKDDVSDMNVVTSTKRRRTSAVVPAQPKSIKRSFIIYMESYGLSRYLKFRLFEVEVEEPVKDPTTNHMMNNDKKMKIVLWLLIPA
ncbi:unnamed protein product [Didymodactylos carnosus]|uniref:Uncharacterized protein n=1 Tax=Didymodactylos carnosus TaxID=1234261 RepID=A0A8S2HSV7_9BILA|nr:unnamed protein product [Didymodactylos carnosus]CAF3678179.1 unnamed protein product [Didymodactylos carnosus]